MMKLKGMNNLVSTILLVFWVCVVHAQENVDLILPDVSMANEVEEVGIYDGQLFFIGKKSFCVFRAGSGPKPEDCYDIEGDLHAKHLVHDGESIVVAVKSRPTGSDCYHFSIVIHQEQDRWAGQEVPLAEQCFDSTGGYGVHPFEVASSHNSKDVVVVIADGELDLTDSYSIYTIVGSRNNWSTYRREIKDEKWSESGNSVGVSFHGGSVFENSRKWISVRLGPQRDPVETLLGGWNDYVVRDSHILYRENTGASPGLFHLYGVDGQIECQFQDYDMRYAFDIAGKEGNESLVSVVPTGIKISTVCGEHVEKIDDAGLGVIGYSSNLFIDNENQRAYVVSPLGIVSIFSISAKTHLADYFWLKGGWVVLTKEGYFNASPSMVDTLQYLVEDEIISGNQFYDVFYRPDIVQAKIRGEDISKLVTVTSVEAFKNPPPIADFTRYPKTIAKDRAEICFQVKSTGGGIGEVRLFQNGKLIKSDGFFRESVISEDRNELDLSARNSAAILRNLRGLQRLDAEHLETGLKGKGNRYEECLEVDAVQGDNEISLAAFNASNSVQSRLETIRFQSSRKHEVPHLYVLGIGIDQYQDPDIALSYAAKDAKDFEAMIRDAASGLFKYGSIHIQELTDLRADKQGIQNALDQLAAKIQPWDRFVLFVASHGILLDNQYYVVTAGFDGTASPDSLISSNEIVGYSKKIKALSQLFIFDTCHAGGVDNIVSGLYDARMSVMAKKMGLHIFASAGSMQEALDGYKGNGLFTHVLLKGMREGNMTDSNGDKQVSVVELGGRVRQETSALSQKLGHSQTPKIIHFGRDDILFEVGL